MGDRIGITIWRIKRIIYLEPNFKNLLIIIKYNN